MDIDKTLPWLSLWTLIKPCFLASKIVTLVYQFFLLFPRMCEGRGLSFSSFCLFLLILLRRIIAFLGLKSIILSWRVASIKACYLTSEHKKKASPHFLAFFFFFFLSFKEGLQHWIILHNSQDGICKSWRKAKNDKMPNVQGELILKIPQDIRVEHKLRGITQDKYYKKVGVRRRREVMERNSH